MKLRNKKTGGLANILADEQDFIRVYTDAGWHDYDSVAEMMDEWEDYKPAEPLIKDEKIRKAVRAWAEVNRLEHFTVVNEHFNCCKIMGRKDNRVSKIEFQTTIPNSTHRIYTLAELCGEIDCEPVKEMEGWRTNERAKV